MSEPSPTASLEAHFERARERTRMTRYFARSPLKIAKTFPREEGVSVCVMDCSPGMLAGDRYEMAWHVGEEARLEVSTQGFTRVHPSSATPCTLKQSIYVGENARLEYFPEPLMLYRDAAFNSSCEVELASNATLLLSEVVCAGRIERGESFAFHFWRSRTHVRRDGKLIYVAHNALVPEQFAPQRVGSWGGFTHAGTLGIFSPRVDAKLLGQVRDILEAQPDFDKVWGGASLLDEGGLVISLLGRRAHDLQAVTCRLRSCVRAFLPA